MEMVCSQSLGWREMNWLTSHGRDDPIRIH